MTLIPELERELTAAIGRTTATAGRRRRAPILRGARGVVIAAVVLAVGTTVALAAGGVIPIGKPATPPPFAKPNPHRGIGIPVPGSERVLGLRTADPGGGPDWGMRIVRTNRGDACLQAARVVDGRLGIVGQDGLFGDDGRFHALPPGPGSPITCSALDANGVMFVNTWSMRVPASAGFAIGRGGCNVRGYTTGVPASSYCRDRDLRAVYYGLLGPRALSITYRTVSGRTRTVAAERPYGAYLIVDRPPPAQHCACGTGASPLPVGTPIEKVTYADGTCTFSLTAETDCPPAGYRPPVGARYTPAQLETPIHAGVRRNGRMWRVRVRFRAPVGVANAQSAYTVRLRPPGTLHHGFAVSATDSDIAKGELVTRDFAYETNSGTYTGEVRYVSGLNGPMAMPGAGTLVGRFTVKVP